LVRLLRFLKPYWFVALLAPLFMLLEVAMDLLQPRLMASIVDNGIMAKDLDHVLRTGGAMFGVALVGLVGGACCTIYSTRASQHFGTDLRQELFDKIQSLSIQSIDRVGTGSLITRLTSDIAQLQQIVLMMLRVFARNTFQMIGAVIMALLISPKLAIITLFMIPLLVATLVITTRKTIPLYSKVQQKLDGVNAVMVENLAGIRVIKAFVRAKHEEQRFGDTNSSLLRSSLKAARIVALNSPIMAIIVNFSIVGVLWYGGVLTRQGSLPVGDLAAFLTYITQLLMSIVGLGNHLMMVSRGKASADRLNEVLELSADKPEALTGAISRDRFIIREGLLEFQGVSFSYDGDPDHAVLSDVTFTAEPGETIGIVGVNGAGKSTLVSLIPRFYEPTKGTIKLDSRPIADINPQELHSQVGMVLQQALLFSGTIRDNIGFGKPDATDSEIEEAARAAQAHEFIVKLPDGYDTLVGQRGVNLSGGQKQRLSIARTLLMKPKLVILDDCTSAVDLTTDRRIRQSLEQVMKESTCLIIGQRIASVEHADRILVLEEGRITAEGTHQELLKHSKLYNQIALSQQGA